MALRRGVADILLVEQVPAPVKIWFEPEARRFGVLVPKKSELPPMRSFWPPSPKITLLPLPPSM